MEWKVRLINSNYTGQETARYVRIVSPGVRTIDDLVAIACDGGGCGIPAETLRAAAHILMNKTRDSVMEGYTVSTPMGTLTPQVKGHWNPDRLQPEARGQNCATLRYTLSSSLKQALADPLFQDASVTGFKLGIYDVEDIASRTHNERLTRGRGVILRGHRLLMNGDLPERGICLVDAETEEAVRNIAPDNFIVNTRNRIIFTIPDDVPSGQYLIRVTSQCTTNARPMKQAASYTTRTPLTLSSD